LFYLRGEREGRSGEEDGGGVMMESCAELGGGSVWDGGVLWSWCWEMSGRLRCCTADGEQQAGEYDGQTELVSIEHEGSSFFMEKKNGV
jgi:hypothetical protein